MVQAHDVVIVIWLADDFFERRTTNAKRGVLGHFPQQKGKIFGIKRNIPIQIGDYVKVDLLDPLVSGVEGAGLAGKTAVAPFRHAQKFYEGMRGSIFLYDLVGAVRRAITHDDPFDWKKRLPDHRLNGQFDEGGFVARRSNQHIFRQGLHVVRLRRWRTARVSPVPQALRNCAAGSPAPATSRLPSSACRRCEWCRCEARDSRRTRARPTYGGVSSARPILPAPYCRDPHP